MRIRAKILIRNDEMVQARKDKGLSQTTLAKSVNASVSVIQRLESLDYHYTPDREYILPIACKLAIMPELIMPEELLDKTINSTILVKQEVSNDDLHLLVDNRHNQPILPAVSEAITKVIDTLSFREREILKLRFGFSGHCYSLQEVGRIFKVTASRIRIIEAKAIRKLQSPVRRKVIEAAL